MSKRLEAWRNLMIAAINAGLDQAIFTLIPKDNEQNGVTYEFEFDGRPAVGWARSAAYGELSIHVMLEPSPQAREYLSSWNAYQFRAEWGATAMAYGFLERTDGKWLQLPSQPSAIQLCGRRPR
jgi:hypothetical protein